MSRLNWIPLGLLVALAAEASHAATSMGIDPASRFLRVEVAEESPPVIELRSDDLLPIRWERQGQRQALLPAVLVRESADLVIVDDANVSYALSFDGALEHVRIEPGFREQLGGWHGQPTTSERNRIVWAGVLFSLGMLLVMLLGKRAMPVAVLYCVVWIAGVAVYQSRRPEIVARDVVSPQPFRAYLARSDQTLRIPIAPQTNWIPVVESMDHLRSLNARIEVAGDRSWMVLDLKRGATVGLTSDFQK